MGVVALLPLDEHDVGLTADIGVHEHERSSVARGTRQGTSHPLRRLGCTMEDARIKCRRTRGQCFRPSR